jgi:uncharacterized membrane protein (UPF0127 family)
MRRAILATGRGRRLRVEIPESRRERSRGLTGRRSLKPGDGMLFLRCRSVHTFGIRFPVTVATLDREFRVLTVRTLAPRRLLLPKPGVRHVLECAAGTAIEPGDRAELRSVGDKLEEEETHEPSDDDTECGRGDHHERHDPADGARKRDGLATSFGGPEAEDLEQ